MNCPALHETESMTEFFKYFIGGTMVFVEIKHVLDTLHRYNRYIFIS
jgi:hypothetical protein